MALDLLAPLALFCFVTAFTPGPNNVMLMTSGLNYGFRRTLPHLLGVAIGFAAMVALVGAGLGAVFAAAPLIDTVMRWAGAAYMLWLAWLIAGAGGIDATGSGGRPLTFIEAALFQWVNPKAWIMAIGAISTYAAIAPFPLNVGLIALIFGVIGLPSSGAWAAFGETLGHLVSSPRTRRAINVAMALLLVASVAPMLFTAR